MRSHCVEDYLGEIECRRVFRTLGIVSLSSWVDFCEQYPKKRRRLRLPVQPAVAYANISFWKEYVGQYPPRWKEFHDLRNQNRPDAVSVSLAAWARYASRYRASSSYRGINFSGLGEFSGRGYSAALGVFLAYSALEAAETAAGKMYRLKSIVDPNLSAFLRAALKAGAEFGEGLSDPKLLSQLVAFMNGESDDVLLMAKALRHLVAHGIFTPWGKGTVSMKAVSALDELAQVLLYNSAKLFHQHCFSSPIP